MAVIKLLTGSGTAEAAPQRQGKRAEPVGKYDRVSSDTFLQMMGIKLNGHKPS